MVIHVESFTGFERRSVCFEWKSTKTQGRTIDRASEWDCESVVEMGERRERGHNEWLASGGAWMRALQMRAQGNSLFPSGRT
jgi:hypothetical protein